MSDAKWRLQRNQTRSALSPYAYLPHRLDVDSDDADHTGPDDLRFVDHGSGTKVPIPSLLFLVRSLELQDLTISPPPLTIPLGLDFNRLLPLFLHQLWTLNHQRKLRPQPSQNRTARPRTAHHRFRKRPVNRRFRPDSQMPPCSTPEKRTKIVSSSVLLPLLLCLRPLHPIRTVQTV